MIRTLIADPPWHFGDALPGKTRGASKQYRTLSLREIVSFLDTTSLDHERESSIRRLLASDCRLFLWRVASMQEEALEVVSSWGFVLKTELVWVKRTATGKPWFGMGRTLRATHETCLVATRGKPEVLSKSVRSVFDAPYCGHSVKPETFYKLVEELSPGPYLELFARKRREGWMQHGNELVRR